MKAKFKLIIVFLMAILVVSCNKDNEIINSSIINNTVNVNAGGLSSILPDAVKDTITSLIIKGVIDARDFKTMRDGMPLLANIDLSGVTIDAYTGLEGTDNTSNTTSINYLANAIPQYAFYAPSGNSVLKSVIIPSSVTLIGESAFNGANGLIYINIPSSVAVIEKMAFGFCINLSSITIPTSVNTIGQYAFATCRSLTSVEIPSSITYIDDLVFYNCAKLTEVIIPSTVTAIGNGAFMNCTSLKSINIPSSVTYLDQQVFAESGLTFVTIPSSISKLGDYNFAQCYNLTTITIPESITSIGDGVFWECSALTSVTIPSSVTSIGSSAFNSCTGLTNIYVKRTNPISLSSSSNVFYKVNKTSSTLYVPTGSKSKYKAAVQWSDFSNIIETTY